MYCIYSVYTLRLVLENLYVLLSDITAYSVIMYFVHSQVGCLS